MSAFNVIWEGSDNLSGDGRNLTLVHVYKMGRPDTRVSDGKAVISGYQMGRHFAPVRRWEGPDMRMSEGKALRYVAHTGVQSGLQNR